MAEPSRAAKPREIPPRPYSLFLEHGSAAKTLISHPRNTASYAGYGSLVQISKGCDSYLDERGRGKGKKLTNIARSPLLISLYIAHLIECV